MTAKDTFNKLLEHAAQLEEPFAVTGVAHAAANEERPHGRFRQESHGHIVGKIAACGDAVHFANLVGPDSVDFFPEKRRQRNQIVHVARARQVILIALEFVLPVGAELQWASQKELRDSRARAAKRRAALAFKKDRSRLRNWLE